MISGFYFIITFLWIAIQLCMSIGLWFPLILSILNTFKKKNITPKIIDKNYNPDYAIIVTAYKQTDFISDVVNSILNIHYDNYIVYVVADNCDISSLKFSSNKVIMLKPTKVLSNNIKSHFYAIEHFIREHEILTIIDSDNLVHPEYLNELNVFFYNGFTAVQGVRKARNLDSIYACLDEAGDVYYRFVDRKLTFGSGSSATLAGSGMAFIVEVYKNALERVDISGAGFDKVLQYELVKKNIKIAFAENGIVYDGKTSHSQQLIKQRARWINAWIKYWKLSWKLIGNSLLPFNWNKFIFSQVMLRPPLFILFLFAFLSIIIDLFFQPVMVMFWAIVIAIFICIFIMALSYFKAEKSIYISLLQIPRFIFYQVIALFKSKRANQLSVATTHEIVRGHDTISY